MFLLIQNQIDGALGTARLFDNPGTLLEPLTIHLQLMEKNKPPITLTLQDIR